MNFGILTRNLITTYTGSIFQSFQFFHKKIFLKKSGTICQDLYFAINENIYWHEFCNPDNNKFFILTS